jgi:hypothetical protein
MLLHVLTSKGVTVKIASIQGSRRLIFCSATKGLVELLKSYFLRGQRVRRFVVEGVL